MAQYDCPFGCKRNGKPIPINTVLGWKRHMTRAHNEYTEEQLAKIVGGGPVDPEQGRAAFLAEAGAPAPSGEEGFSSDAKPATPAQPTSPFAAAEAAEAEQRAKTIKTDAAAKKFNAKLNKMKKKIADAFPESIASAIKDKGAEWQMSDDDVATLSESIENVFEVLDVDFQVVPFNKTLSNPFWVFLLPLLALIAVFVPKAIKNAKLIKDGPGPESAAPVR